MKKVTLNKRHNNLVEYFDLVETDNYPIDNDKYVLRSHPYIYIADSDMYEIHHERVLDADNPEITLLIEKTKILYKAMYIAMRSAGYKFTNDHNLLEEK
tara:strand:- start:5221 stop:5517 length:297 start_codon:yes stop_codon:yes gene_type:complete